MGILLSVLSYFFDAVANHFDKFLVTKVTTKPINITIFSGIFTCIIGLVIYVAGGFSSVDLKSALIVFISGVFTELILLAYFKALSLERASLVVPLFQFIPVFVLVLSYFLLGEHLKPAQLLGGAIVVTGGLILSLQRSKQKKMNISRAFWYMMAACLCSAFGIVLFKLGSVDTGFWQAIPYEGFGMLFCTTLLYGFSARKSVKKEFKKINIKGYLLLASEEGFVLVSRYMRYFATFFIPVSVISILLGLQPLFAVLISVVFSRRFPSIIQNEFKTPELVAKVGTMAVMLVGVVFILI